MLMVYVLLACWFIAREGRESRGSAAATSEQLNETAILSEANELIATHQVGWNEAKRRGRTLLLLVYREWSSSC